MIVLTSSVVMLAIVYPAVFLVGALVTYILYRLYRREVVGA